MDKLVKPSRLASMIMLITVLIVSYVAVLYKLQIVEGADYYEESRNNRPTTVAVTASRGNIMDRYGRVLVSNKECNNIYLDTNTTDGLFSLDIEETNALILELVRIVEECGDKYIDELPITMESPFEYTKMTAIESTRLSAYLKDKNMEADTGAVELMSYFRSRYKIDNNYSNADMRIIAGVRYEINVRFSAPTSDYIFVEDASNELITRLLEEYPAFVEVKTSYVREYNTQYAAHLLGYTGMMTSGEYEKYSRYDYALDAQVGKDGVELAFESWLHGGDGEARVISTATGTVISTVYTKDPEPGNHVYLTIDILLQEAAERALAAGIEKLQRDRETNNEEALAEGRTEDIIADPIKGGALVAVDVKTGEPLAIASYPSFDLSSFMEDYDSLLEAENDPLFDRALMGAYAPGSTFKPCTAIAVLTEGIVNTEDKIKCEGVFTKYADQGYAPQCWIYGKGLHGEENTTLAIRDSCNYYFYTVGNDLGVDKLGEYAHNFGLGVKTGIELTETVGNMANRENHELYSGGEPWYIGDTLQAAIGQSDSIFTPLQLAEYCATIANSGTRYSASILNSVRSFDYSETLYSKETEVLSRVESADYNWAAVHNGMFLVANDPYGSAYTSLFGYSYNDRKIEVAAKTGTSQLGEGITNNAIFICYAPFNDPQIAIAIVAERGAAGSDMGFIAKEVLNAYFGIKSASTRTETDNTLLR